MATQNSNSAAPVLEVRVAGFKVLENGSICMILKDKVSKHAMLSAKTAGATKTGTVFMSSGYTLEEIKEAYPYGAIVEGAKWGAPVVRATATGEQMQGIFAIEGL